MTSKQVQPGIGVGALGPLGLLPRWLSALRIEGRRIVSTLLDGHPLLSAIEDQRHPIVTLAPRAAIEAVPVEGPLHWLPCDSETEPPIVLGARNADVAWPPAWRVGFTDTIVAKVRTLDAVAGGSGVRAVLLGGGSDPGAAIEGGQRTLRSSACPVMFDLGGLDVSQKSAALEAVRDALPRKYGIRDAMLQPLGAEPYRTWFVAAPESEFTARSLSARFALKKASRTLRFDDKVRCVGFYPAEGDRKATCRKLGPQPRGIVCLARPFWGPGNIEISGSGTGDLGGLAAVRLIVDGEICTTSTTIGRKSAWRIAARFTSIESMDRAAMNVGIYLPEEQVEGDPRKFGISVSRVRVFQ